MKLSLIIALFFLPTVVMTNFLALSFSDFIYKDFFKDPEDLHYVTNVTNYLKFGQKLNDKYFSQQAVQHMSDVKNLFNTAKAVNASVLFVFLSFIIYSIYKKKYVFLKKGLILGVIISTLVILLILICSMLNFDISFVIFHKILFRNGLWLFEPNDSLVKLFTEDFFILFLEKLVLNISVTLFLTLSVIKLIPNDSKSN